ncbi:zinc-binding dehydrogenase [Nitrospira defluvii]|nr:zinc-binding dehydrogenase [Nitrospira defluvii]
MKAVRFHQFGGPEVLVYEDAPQPNPGPGEVRVRVKVCALNHLDLWITGGIPAYHTELPHIPGCDISGIVECLGEGVPSIYLNKKIFISPGISCFRCRNCLSGRDHLCDTYQIVGAGPDGGYAEFVKVSEANLMTIPEGVSFEAAAAFPLTFLTAWHMLVTRAGLQSGQDLLVLAGGSGVGSAAIQIGKLIGARVIATASQAKKLEYAQLMGADFVIDYTKDDFSKAVRKITEKRGVHVVFEHVGPDTFGKSLRSLAKGGKLVTCGATSGPTTELDLRYIFSRELEILGAKMGTRAELIHVAALIGEGKLKPVIDSVYPLSEARAAQEKMLQRDFFGKLILKP